jgi:hypothetical protein
MGIFLFPDCQIGFCSCSLTARSDPAGSLSMFELVPPNPLTDLCLHGFFHRILLPKFSSWETPIEECPGSFSVGVSLPGPTGVICPIARALIEFCGSPLYSTRDRDFFAICPEKRQTRAIGTWIVHYEV